MCEGRFYLHTVDGSNSILVNKDDLQVYISGKKIYINGEVTEHANIMVYTIQGILIHSFTPQSSTSRQLDANDLESGVYLLGIMDKQTVKANKLSIEIGF